MGDARVAKLKYNLLNFLLKIAEKKKFNFVFTNYYTLLISKRKISFLRKIENVFLF